LIKIDQAELEGALRRDAGMQRQQVSGSDRGTRSTP